MDRNQFLHVVDRVPDIVARHDREAWLALFSSDAIVEGPVGAGPNHRGRDLRGGLDGLSRFYEVFIAPNHLEYTVRQRIATDDEVVHDATIRIILPNGAVNELDVYLLFRGLEENGVPKIKGLHAYWDFPGIARKLKVDNGTKGHMAAMAQFRTMLRIQGLKRVREYYEGMRKGIFEQGWHAVHAFCAAVNTRDISGFVALLEPQAVIEFPVGTQSSALEFMSRESGRLRLAVAGLRSAGWHTIGSFEAASGPLQYHGIALFAFDHHTHKILSIRFFCHEQACLLETDHQKGLTVPLKHALYTTTARRETAGVRKDGEE